MTSAAGHATSGGESLSNETQEGDALGSLELSMRCASYLVEFTLPPDEELYWCDILDFVRWAEDVVALHRDDVRRRLALGIEYMRTFRGELVALKADPDMTWVAWLSEAFWTAQDIPSDTVISAAEGALASYDTALARGDELAHARARYEACDPAYDAQRVFEVAADVVGDVWRSLEDVEALIVRGNRLLLEYNEDVLIGARVGEVTFTFVNVTAFAAFGVASSAAVTTFAGGSVILAAGASALSNVLQEAGKQAGEVLAGSRTTGADWKMLGKEALAGFFGAGELLGVLGKTLGRTVLHLLPDRLSLLATMVGDLASKRLVAIIDPEQLKAEWAIAFATSFVGNAWQILVRDVVNRLAGDEPPQQFTWELFVKICAEGLLPGIVDRMNLSKELKDSITAELLKYYAEIARGGPGF